MGDATYNHIYNATDSTGSVTQRLRSDARAQPEGQGGSGSPEEQPRDSSASPEAAAGCDMDALHDAIVNNTDSSAALIAAGTPTGAHI